MANTREEVNAAINVAITSGALTFDQGRGLFNLLADKGPSVFPATGSELLFQGTGTGVVIGGGTAAATPGDQTPGVLASPLPKVEEPGSIEDITPGPGGGPLPQGGAFTVADIERDFKNGDLTNAQATDLLQSLNVTDPAALLQFWGIGGSGASVTAAPTPPDTAVPTADPTLTGDTPVAANAQTRADLLRFQAGDDQRRRLQAEFFGENITGPGRTAANFALNQFFRQQPITNTGNRSLTPISEAFRGFQGQRPTAGQLTSGLQGIQAAGATDPFFIQEFLERERPAQSAFGASIQPALLGINPRIQGDISGILNRQFATEFAQTPDLFTQPQQILDLLTRFQGF